jgi:hypothetical protein
MIDIIEEYERCDWCGSHIWNIGPSVSGFMFHRYNVYLCGNPKCGHEMEFIPMKYDPSNCVEIKYPL